MVDNITYVKDGDLQSDLLGQIVLIIVVMYFVGYIGSNDYGK